MSDRFHYARTGRGVLPPRDGLASATPLDPTPWVAPAGQRVITDDEAIRAAKRLVGLPESGHPPQNKVPSVEYSVEYSPWTEAEMDYVCRALGEACEKDRQSSLKPRDEAAVPMEGVEDWAPAEPPRPPENETAQERYFRECREAGNKARRDLGLPELPEHYIHPEWDDRAERETAQSRPEPQGEVDYDEDYVEKWTGKGRKPTEAEWKSHWTKRDAARLAQGMPPGSYWSWNDYILTHDDGWKLYFQIPAGVFREPIHPSVPRPSASRKVTSSPTVVAEKPATTKKSTRVKGDPRWHTSTYMKPRPKSEPTPKPTAAEIAANTALSDHPDEITPEIFRELITRERLNKTLDRESRRQRNRRDLANVFCSRMIETKFPLTAFSDMEYLPNFRRNYGYVNPEDRPSRKEDEQK